MSGGSAKDVARAITIICFAKASSEDLYSAVKGEENYYFTVRESSIWLSFSVLPGPPERRQRDRRADSVQVSGAGAGRINTTFFGSHLCPSGAGGLISFSPPVESLLSITVCEGAPRSSRHSKCAGTARRSLRVTALPNTCQPQRENACDSQRRLPLLHSASFSSRPPVRLRFESACCSLRGCSLSAGSLDSLSDKNPVFPVTAERVRFHLRHIFITWRTNKPNDGVVGC